MGWSTTRSSSTTIASAGSQPARPPVPTLTIDGESHVLQHPSQAVLLGLNTPPALRDAPHVAWHIDSILEAWVELVTATPWTRCSSRYRCWGGRRWRSPSTPPTASPPCRARSRRVPLAGRPGPGDGRRRRRRVRGRRRRRDSRPRRPAGVRPAGRRGVALVRARERGRVPERAGPPRSCALAASLVGEPPGGAAPPRRAALSPGRDRGQLPRPRRSGSSTSRASRGCSCRKR